jgi:hypothetical protein
MTWNAAFVGAFQTHVGYVVRRRVRSMSELAPSIIFTPRASGDGTWYVEVESPGLACEHVGDFRSRESAEARIRESQRSRATHPARQDDPSELPTTS